MTMVGEGCRVKRECCLGVKAQGLLLPEGNVIYASPGPRHGLFIEHNPIPSA